MKRNSKLSRKLLDPRGSALIFIAFFMVIMLAFVGLAIDIGYLMVVRNELQNAADAAALAATRQLSNQYQGKVPPFDMAQILPKILARAQEAAGNNYAAAKKITEVLPEDIKVGWWDFAMHEFTNPPESGICTAVQVTIRRDKNVADGEIPTFIARAFGVKSLPAVATAVAALSSQSTADEGVLVPVGISTAWTKNCYDPSDPRTCCQRPITFNKTGESCAGWTNYTGLFGGKNPSEAEIGKLIQGLTDGTLKSPPVKLGDIFYFNGGTQDKNFEFFQLLFEAMKGLNDGILDKDIDKLTWTTTAAIYDDSSCVNPNKGYAVVGFATVIIKEVIKPPGEQWQINGVFGCDYTDPGRGGGNNWGTFGVIPGLVK